MLRSKSNDGADSGTQSPETTQSPGTPGIGDRAQAMGSNLVSLVIGVMIAAIVVIQVFIPTVNDAISSSSVDGTTATILGLLGLFAALLVLISLASPLMRRI